MREIPMASLGRLHVLWARNNKEDIDIQIVVERPQYWKDQAAVRIICRRAELEEFIGRIETEVGLSRPPDLSELTEEMKGRLENYAHGRAMGLKPKEAWELAGRG